MAQDTMVHNTMAQDTMAQDTLVHNTMGRVSMAVTPPTTTIARWKVSSLFVQFTFIINETIIYVQMHQECCRHWAKPFA